MLTTTCRINLYKHLTQYERSIFGKEMHGNVQVFRQLFIQIDNEFIMYARRQIPAKNLSG